VLALAEQGASVVIDYIAHPEATDELERKITDLGGRALGVEADVSKVADLGRLVDAAVNAFGRLDVMVNNAEAEDARRRHPAGTDGQAGGDRRGGRVPRRRRRRLRDRTTVFTDGGLMQSSPGL